MKKDTTIVICSSLPDESGFLDNVTGKCAICGTGIFWRPHMPKEADKVCFKCGMAKIDKTNPKDMELKITKETKAEIEHMSKN